MKFVLAPDSFKGSLTAKQAASAMQRGLSRIFPSAEFIQVPMADGGAGTAQSLVDARHGEFITAEVNDPLMHTISARYGLIKDSHYFTGIIEVAEASGLGYLNDDDRNPLITTTYGTGQLVKDALDKGVNRIIIAIGGSATNDGGAGMFEALGVRFLDSKGNPIPRGGGGLGGLVSIDMSNIDPRLADVEFVIATDVANPMVGEYGASAVFAPNKGATPEMVETLDQNLTHYADVLQRFTGKDIKDMPGSGSSGGLAGGVMAFTNAHIVRGVDLVAKVAKLDEKVVGADYTFTGEGMVDYQTQYGKTPLGVAIEANKGNPDTHVIIVTGGIGDGIDELYNVGVDAIFSMTPGAMSLDKAMQDAAINLERTTENIGRLIKVDGEKYRE
ncbi:glycerate kinase [Levilactobacillus bambusae]|uniref:Glycerate 2-kinase n=1 Tax=Levilactobacillus bambusae TaxID=2024736 RepID=A0A2V1N0D8_9LACO|nr:glycerate kinase [Levilactobacillus bambusae]PWF99809.1 glycerate 2-kinase [Levilactobacillus bambusae]